MNYITVDGRFCVLRDSKLSQFFSCADINGTSLIVEDLPPLRDFIYIDNQLALLTQDNDLLIYHKTLGFLKKIPNVKSALYSIDKLIILDNQGSLYQLRGDVSDKEYLMEDIRQIFLIKDIYIAVTNEDNYCIFYYNHHHLLEEIDHIIKSENYMVHSSDKIYQLKDYSSDNHPLLSIDSKNIKSAISVFVDSKDDVLVKISGILAIYEDGNLKLHIHNGVRDIQTDLIINRFLLINGMEMVEDVHGNLYEFTVNNRHNSLDLSKIELPLRPLQQAGIPFKSLKPAKH